MSQPIELASWEGQKENIQPVKTGRLPGALKEAFGSAGTTTAPEMEKAHAQKLAQDREYVPYTLVGALRCVMHRKFEAKLQSSGDVLDVWLRYATI